MPIERMLSYLRNNKKSLGDKFFEVYIGLVVGEAQQIIVKKENMVYMDYNYFLQYLLDYKANSIHNQPWIYERSVVLFFVYEDGNLPVPF